MAHPAKGRHPFFYSERKCGLCFVFSYVVSGFKLNEYVAILDFALVATKNSESYENSSVVSRK
jgi:hypothetical protein